MIRSLLDRLLRTRPIVIEIGDLVQWEQDGIFQLEGPTPVRFITECGLWVVVEGSNTGLPMAEIILVKKHDAG